MSAALVFPLLFVAGLFVVAVAAFALLFFPSVKQFAGPLLGGYVCMGIGAAGAIALALVVILGLRYGYIWLLMRVLHLASSQAELPVSLVVLALAVAAIVGGAAGWKSGWNASFEQPRKKGSA